MSRRNAEVLYTSGAVLSRLKNIFASPTESDVRVAVVAYIGDDALYYLPSPQGLRVICSPSPGATSARVLRTLIHRGAHVQFSEKLHAKIYWSKNRGCVIGSANASSSALGVGGLKEAAVYLPPGAVDIDRFIREVRPEDVTEGALRRLQNETRKLPQRFRLGSDRGGKRESEDFRAWFNSPYPHSDTWKLGWADSQSSGAFSKSAISKAKADYGVKQPYGWLNVAKGTVSRDEWLLYFEVSRNRLNKFEWLYVDFIVPVEASDKKAYEAGWPYQAIQVHPSKKCPSPPFKITTPFRVAFEAAVNEWGVDRLTERRSLSVPRSLLSRTNLLMAK